MTKELIQKIGYNVTVDQNYIQVSDINKSSEKTIIVESDWSSASYFYSIAAFSHDAEITLKSFNRDSIQGDSIVSKIYKKLGVDTIYMKDYIIIKKNKNVDLPKKVKLDLSDIPDLAQTIAVSCLGLGIECELTGLRLSLIHI